MQTITYVQMSETKQKLIALLIFIVVVIAAGTGIAYGIYNHGIKSAAT
jgi:hypothetical protein